MHEDVVKINEIFYSIQGEGPHVGTPTLFYRTQGCDVGCDWCDTKKSWPGDEGSYYGLDGLKYHLQEGPLSVNPTVEGFHVCITGGEPLQANLSVLTEFVRYLRSLNIFTTIETSGVARDTLKAYNFLKEFDCVVMSPKAHMLFNGDFTPLVHVFKTVVCDTEDIDRALLLQRHCPAKLHYIQPRSNRGELAKLCIEACKTHKLKLSMQMHKVLNVR